MLATRRVVLPSRAVSSSLPVSVSTSLPVPANKEGESYYPLKREARKFKGKSTYANKSRVSINY